MESFLAALVQDINQANREKPHQSTNPKLLDSMTFGEYAQSKSINGTSAAVKAATSLAAALLGVEVDGAGALFIVDYLQSGTGLSNMGSDRKDGAQYSRNRQGDEMSYHFFSEPKSD